MKELGHRQRGIVLLGKVVFSMCAASCTCVYKASYFEQQILITCRVIWPLALKMNIFSHVLNILIACDVIKCHIVGQILYRALFHDNSDARTTTVEVTSQLCMGLLCWILQSKFVTNCPVLYPKGHSINWMMDCVCPTLTAYCICIHFCSPKLCKSLA